MSLGGLEPPALSFVTKLKDQGKSADLIVGVRTVLSAIFTTSLNDQITYLHPCKGVKAPVIPVTRSSVSSPHRRPDSIALPSLVERLRTHGETKELSDEDLLFQHPEEDTWIPEIPDPNAEGRTYKHGTLDQLSGLADAVTRFRTAQGRSARSAAAARSAALLRTAHDRAGSQPERSLRQQPSTAAKRAVRAALAGFPEAPGDGLHFPPPEATEPSRDLHVPIRSRHR